MSTMPTPPGVADGPTETPSFFLGNTAEPIHLSGVNLCGVTAAPARAGEKVEVWTRMTLTSADALFHRIVPHLSDVIEGLARGQDHPVSLSRHSLVLLVIRPGDTAELWLDAAAVIADSRLRKGAAEAGTVLFEGDIADISGMWFPCVEIGSGDRILCIFREGWRFGLLFDFSEDGDLDIARARRDLGTLLRRLRYARLYEAVAHDRTFPSLVQVGWFPFLELLSREFGDLVGHVESDLDLDPVEEKLVSRFDEQRLDRMFQRWMTRPHFSEREAILRSGLNAFKAADPVATIKIVLTEIEGVLSEAHFRATGERTHKMSKLLKFVEQAATTRAGGQDTLFFPVEFTRYLKDYTFAGFVPGAARTASRNAVGHGALPAEQYTMVRALQTMLTLDQVAFYT